MEGNRTILDKTIRHVLRVTVGIVLLAVGIVGLMLPVLPGWPFIASGIILVWPKTRLATWLLHVPARIREWFRKRGGPPEEGRPTDRPDRRATRDPDVNAEHNVLETRRP
jgi:hypothetical protein